ncbi:superoxide dismutase [Ilyomonas limi]|uniref:Superoxide dismutase n=1 Tax=Ilyomonas limi TaxID=2575867 RepID=A0A4U3KV78_9BACT|nr:superoxide dismutase [Ilyomonas limi]TKK64916.1 superoxide dismutase [Ilyomonas limi]
MTNENTSRRDFMKTTGKACIAAGLATSILPSLSCTHKAHAQTAIRAIPYTQTPLPYVYNALEPVIDAQTMELHYTKHAASYAKNLSEAMQAENVNTRQTSLEQLLVNISKYSIKMRNNAGGHYNHELFWQSMNAPSAAPMPSGKLLAAVEKDFNSFATFQNEFNNAAKNCFGSGWAWLMMTNDKKLVIGSTPDQDNPLMDVSPLRGMPLFGLDVWEHAYYLKYQNRRPEYITEWWKTVNWDFIQQRFEAMI